MTGGGEASVRARWGRTGGRKSGFRSVCGTGPSKIIKGSGAGGGMVET